MVSVRKGLLLVMATGAYGTATLDVPTCSLSFSCDFSTVKTDQPGNSIPPYMGSGGKCIYGEALLGKRDEHCKAGCGETKNVPCECISDKAANKVIAYLKAQHFELMLGCLGGSLGGLLFIVAVRCWTKVAKVKPDETEPGEPNPDEVEPVEPKPDETEPKTPLSNKDKVLGCLKCLSGVIAIIAIGLGIAFVVQFFIWVTHPDSASSVYARDVCDLGMHSRS
eukprot:TRINITY_DN63152_c0_g1_i1.p1 TRINITY_DN63152_c0_g1~~TRINITY_DN63152_c0_g1_i1.p1  ORF type:complete len:223 (+),score=26.18 TRINITY_DN63152_c0_g1_i1:58-726(+)